MAEKKEVAEQANGKAKAPKVDPKAKVKAVTVKAARHIPLSMILDAKDVPLHLRRHPGGARVEKDTELAVSAEVADYLKAIGYAK